METYRVDDVWKESDDQGTPDTTLPSLCSPSQMAHSKVLILFILVTGSLGTPLPQTSFQPEEAFQPYTSPQYAAKELELRATSRLVAGKNGQLVRTYPASALRRLRLVPVLQEPSQAQGQQVYYQSPLSVGHVLGSHKAQQAEQEQTGAYVQQQPRLQKPLFREKAQVLTQTQEEPEEEYPSDPNPQYNFSFDVKDDELTNYQNRQEERDGGVIKGSYSVVDPDGYVRTVTYTADAKNGFQAKVVREPTEVKVKFPVPTLPPEAQLKTKTPLRTQAFYTQQPQVYTQGTHLQPTYVLRRVPTNHETSAQVAPSYVRQ